MHSCNPTNIAQKLKIRTTPLKAARDALEKDGSRRGRKSLQCVRRKTVAENIRKATGVKNLETRRKRQQMDPRRTGIANYRGEYAKHLGKRKRNTATAAKTNANAGVPREGEQR